MLQRGRIVDAIASDGDGPAQSSGRIDETQFVLGRRPGDDGETAELATQTIVPQVASSAPVTTRPASMPAPRAMLVAVAT